MAATTYYSIFFFYPEYLIHLLCDKSHVFLQPFTNDFPWADIHELLSPDLLHQLIKGTFKDHLVTWVESYLISTHGPTHAKEVMDDIDKR